ncbi:MAG: hypothetical protein ACKPKO_62670, partial [Candidatus Fonsibacter sp.]
GEAIQKIIEQRPDTRRERKRNKEFNEARANVVTVFKRVDAKSRKVRQLALSDYAKLVAPVAHLIRLKMEQLEGVGDLLENHKELLKRLGDAIDTKSSNVVTDALLGDIAVLEKDISWVACPLAFRDHD